MMFYVEFVLFCIFFYWCLEIVVVVLYYYFFYFGVFLGIVIIFGLFFMLYYLIVIIYLIWVYLIDGCIFDYGGWWLEFVRKVWVWKYFRDYFLIKLIKMIELDLSKNYVFGYYFYGVLCVGVFCNFVIEVMDFSNIFFGIILYLLLLMGEWIIKKLLFSSLEKFFFCDWVLKYYVNNFVLMFVWLI